MKPKHKLSVLRKFFINSTFLFLTNSIFGWGFCAHKEINRYAIFTLPYPLFQFYKRYLGYITEHAVDPDKRRLIDFSEKEKHFIDLDFYIKNQDCDYIEVLENFLSDEERRHGISPLNIVKVKYDLTNAFRNLDTYRIVKLSADIGHYIGDLNVPLHTTSNYDGGKDGQEGVHALWESRLPELFKKNYKYFVAKASYVENPMEVVWKTVLETYRVIDALLEAEKKTAEQIKIGTHSYESKNSYSKKVYSEAYAKEFNKKLRGQVEKQLLKSIKMLGDFWFSCWVDAGSPDLSAFIESKDCKEYFVEPDEDFEDKEDDEYEKDEEENPDSRPIRKEEEIEYCEMR